MTNQTTGINKMKTQEQLGKEYNGWKGNGSKSSAYATWRVNLEIVDGLDLEMWHDPSNLQDMVKEIVLHDVDKDSLAASYALAFLDDVNYQEIHDHYV